MVSDGYPGPDGVLSGFVLNRDPLRFGEFVYDRVAVVPTETERFHASKGDLRVVVERHIVDVDHPGFDLVSDIHRVSLLAEHGGGETHLGAVGYRERFFVVRDLDHRGDRSKVFVTTFSTPSGRPAASKSRAMTRLLNDKRSTEYRKFLRI